MGTDDNSIPHPFTRRVVVVDDDTLVRELLVTQLRQWGFDVSSASSSTEAVTVCRDFDPDAVVLDVDLGASLNGFQLAEALVRRFPHLSLVFLTRFPDARASISRLSPSLRDAAYVNKNAINDAAEILDALNAALRGRGDSVRHDERANRPLASLTRAQLEVMRLMYEGKTNAQIAELRGTSISAAEKIVSRVFSILGVERHVANARSIVVRIYGETYGGNSLD